MPSAKLDTGAERGLRAGEHIIERGLTGRVLWYDRKKGFGKIQLDDTRSAFVAYACLLTPRRTAPNGDTIEIEEGDLITCDLTENSRGYKAVNVELQS